MTILQSTYYDNNEMKWKIFLVLFFVLGILFGYYLHTKNKPSTKPQTQQPTVSVCNALTMTNPQKGQKITSPLTVTVTIDNTKSCHWTVFEAQAGTLTLQDNTGKIIGTGRLTTSANWMTDKPVTYTGTIEFTKPETNELQLLIEEENPSGQESQTVTIPLMY